MPMSLRDAAVALGVNRMWLSGYCVGKGIKLTRYKTSLCIPPGDFRRLQKFLSGRKAA